MDSVIISLISGHLFSKGVDAGQGRFQSYMQEKDLSRILDEYNDAFKHQYDTEISLNNCDMEAVFEKRDFLISCAKENFLKNNSEIKKNLKQKFIDTACEKIGDSSEVIKTYLDCFYLLVFTKETREVSVGFRALLNAYADSQYEINEKTDKQIKTQREEIDKLKNEIKIVRDIKAEPIDFRPYYQIVEEEFTEEKEESLVGSESDENAFIDAYIGKGDDSVPVLPFLEEWFGKKNSGTILIYGEPGHGKTMLCRKAMVEFFRGKYLKGKAENVISVSLNIGDNPSIIEGGRVTLSNSLAWGEEREHRFSFEECRGSLLFMDGFDEFIDDAKRSDNTIKNICHFMKRVNGIARDYGIHIVVLSRTIAVSNYLKDLSTICNSYELSPVSKMQQDEWLERHHQYSDYKEEFQSVRRDNNMQALLGVPLLFRLIVHNRFDGMSSNTVELYNKLFIHLMNKRNIYDDKDIQFIEKELMNLAYEVYCTDSNMAVLENVEGDPGWLITFYVKRFYKGKVGFFHRTFYQYYFAKYIYLGIINLKGKEENFIGLFAERELDDTICVYLSFLLKEEDKSIVYANVECLINALSRTEAYLNFKPHVGSGDAEKSKILRSTNIYKNILKIAASFSYVIQLPFKENLDLLMRTYNSDSVILVSDNNKRVNLEGANLNKAQLIGAGLRGANLSGADLSRADLNGADLSGADLSMANLSGADMIITDLSGAFMVRAELCGTYLSDADLIRANLVQADLSGANLSGSDLGNAYLGGAVLNGADLRKTTLCNADLSGAFLRGADLEEADLRGADLSEAILSRANLSKAKLRGANLSRADLSGAFLNGADLREVTFCYAKIDIRYKDIIDLSVEDYYTIDWSSDEGDEQ